MMHWKLFLARKFNRKIRFKDREKLKSFFCFSKINIKIFFCGNLVHDVIDGSKNKIKNHSEYQSGLTFINSL